MNYIDLFSGIGGFALGAYWAGMKFENHYFSEVEPFAVELYQKRFPDAIPLGDITKIKTEDLPHGEYIITGGFPCQDISIAGKGAGITGKRSGLWFEYWRLIRDLRPKYAVMENVGMLVHRGLREVLGSLAEIGYNAEWQDIRAEDIGAPHKRERIWIVAYPGRSTEGAPLNGSGATVQNSNGTENGLFKQDCESNGDFSNTDNSMLQRGQKVRNTKRKRTDDKQQYKRQGQCPRGKNWPAEPAVGRLVTRISTELDSTIRRMKNENSNDKETVTAVDRYIRNVLSGMWEKRKPAKTPYGGKSGFSYCLVSEMPYEITYEEWDLGAWIEKDKELCDMWESLYSKSQQETQDLLKKMSIRIRENQCEQKMAENRVNRLKGLGNAIVPQIAELLFRQIKDLI